jgi:hypothetical protein
VTGLDKCRRVWKILCRDFFDSYLSPELTIVDLACGYGEFVNSVTAARRIAIDLNPDASGYLMITSSFIASPPPSLAKSVVLSLTCCSHRTFSNI